MRCLLRDVARTREVCVRGVDGLSRFKPEPENRSGLARRPTSVPRRHERVAIQIEVKAIDDSARREGPMMRRELGGFMRSNTRDFAENP
jgi:hypothetical protein